MVRPSFLGFRIFKVFETLALDLPLALALPLALDFAVALALGFALGFAITMAAMTSCAVGMAMFDGPGLPLMALIAPAICRPCFENFLVEGQLETALKDQIGFQTNPMDSLASESYSSAWLAPTGIQTGRFLSARLLEKRI